MSENSLQIGRLSNHYLLAESAASVDTDKKRFDSMAAGQLTHCLGQALSPLFSTESGVVLLDKLECELTLDSSHSDQAIAHSWAAEITRLLSRRLRDDTSQAMVYFDCPEALLAAFLTALVSGEAWSSWIYRSFDGLKMLPLSAALRTAILDNPEKGLNALLGLKSHEQQKIVRALGETECSRILLAWARHEKKCDSDPDATAEQRLNSIYLHEPNTPAQRLESIRAHAPNASALLLFLQANSRQMRDSATEAQTETRIEPSSHATDTAMDTDEVIRSTPYGGAILLLRFVAELPIDELTGLDAEDAVCLRLMILAKALGSDRYTEVFNDPLMRDLLSAPPALTVAVAIDWAMSQKESLWQEWMMQIADWRCGQWPAKADEQLLSNRFGLYRLLRENAKGAWLYGVRTDNLSELNRLNSPITCSPWPLDKVDKRILRRSLADLRYLRVSEIADYNENYDLPLSVMAQGVLRDFSFCLPGFSDSTLSFLYDNFLAFNAQLEEVDEGYQAHCGRPPLNLILNITSLQRQQFRLPWNPSRSLSLFPES